MFNKHDIRRNECMLTGGQAKCGYDWWWHSFTGYHALTGEAKPFFIEFFLCNPESGGDEPIFGQLPSNKEKGIKPSYLMVKAGAWGEDATQLHRFYGWNQIEVDFGVPFHVKADECYVDEISTYGHVQVSAEDAQNHPEYMCESGEMSWNLKIDKVTAFNVGYGASTPFRRMQAFEMFWHAEGMKSAFEGEVIWNGETYKVSKENSYGYADKNWGKNFTSPWVWLSSNNLTSKLTGKKLTDSVFDIGGGRPKIGPVALSRKLLSAFWYEGKAYEFNFSKFWTFARTFFDCKETDTQIIWHVEQKTWRNKMVTDITCEKKDMLLVNYEAPNGDKFHNRLWNGGNGKGTVKLYRDGKLLDEILAENIGCEYGEYC
ncbi:MAG: hypothetical protein E7299_02340 [Lachnospiraceae bacterium]|nr:hypothetical protein [Lachnospiraceae bacterium]